MLSLNNVQLRECVCEETYTIKSTRVFVKFKALWLVRGEKHY